MKCKNCDHPDPLHCRKQINYWTQTMSDNFWNFIATLIIIPLCCIIVLPCMLFYPFGVIYKRFTKNEK